MWILVIVVPWPVKAPGYHTHRKGYFLASGYCSPGKGDTEDSPHIRGDYSISPREHPEDSGSCSGRGHTRVSATLHFLNTFKLILPPGQILLLILLSTTFMYIFKTP